MNARFRSHIFLPTLGLSLAYGLLVLFVHVRNSVVRSRSEAMYAEFLKLHPGETTKTDIEILRKRFVGSLPQNADCRSVNCEYTIGKAVWSFSRWALLTRFAHDHMPTSQLTLNTKGNLLSSASFSVGVWVPKGYGTREERKKLSDPKYAPYSSGEYVLFGRASLTNELPERCCDSRSAAKPNFVVWGPSSCMNCLAIFVSALPSLEQATRARVFDFNFNCMTQWSMCTDKEDIMPIAGQELAKESASEEPSK